MKRAFFNTIQVMFAILMTMIAVATIVLDKNVANPFPNTVTYANGAYYLAACIALFLSLAIHRRIYGQRDIDIRIYRGIMITIPLIVGGWQIAVSQWIYWYKNASDFGSIMQAATGFNSGMDFTAFPYFLRAPNNANLAIMLSWIYKIIPDWRCILLIGAILTNISAVLIAVSVKNITNNRFASVISLVLAEPLMAMTWRAFIVYTDNFGMIFVALIIWIYSLKIKDKYKMPLIIVVAAIGTFIKFTVFICLLAILIYQFIIGISQSDKLVDKIKKGIGILILTVSIFGVMLYTQKSLQSYYGLELAGKYPIGLQYWFMIGQNSEYYGAYNRSDVEIWDAVIEEARSLNEGVDYVNNIQLEIGIDRIRERGFLGNIKFYIKKLNVAYNDGYFHNVQALPPAVSHELSPNLLYKLLWKEDGSLYQISAGILQVAWDAVLLSLMAGAVLLRKRETYKLYQIMILGITLYLMIFENRSKYLYMFLPVYLCAAGISFAECKNQYIRMKNALMYYDQIEGDEER